MRTKSRKLVFRTYFADLTSLISVFVHILFIAAKLFSASLISTVLENVEAFVLLAEKLRLDYLE